MMWICSMGHLAPAILPGSRPPAAGAPAALLALRWDSSSGPAREVAGHVELLRRVLRTHPAHHAEDRPFGPGPVEAAEAPEDAAVRVGIATVDRPAVVELDHHR